MKISRQSSHRPILTDLELFQALSVYNQATRVAILLMLSEKMTPEEIVYLTWKQTKTMSLSKDAVKLLNGAPRWLFSDQVFWEEVDGEAMPLLNFHDDVDMLLGVFTLTEFRELYKNMVCVAASSKAFIRRMSQEIFSRS